jgi:hypothetical protein
MAEDTDTQVTDGAATATDETAQQPELGDAGQRALREERRKAREAAKERDALQARLKEYEDRDKTEQQRLTESQAAAEQRAQAAELRAARLEVAHEKGLTPAQAKRLVGTTREELEADAEEVLKDFPVAAASQQPPKAPKPDPSQGSRPAAAGASVDAGAALYAQKHKKPTTVT